MSVSRLARTVADAADDREGQRRHDVREARSSSRSTVLMTSNCWRAQDGH
jgi:hypothetical protein